ncbi:MAG TPA: hypothetical protein VFH80_05050 [Solirubrobacteraceae bacterium]|nr:hypothetical protein [Solirubrobacteraceae bacterium]
MCSDITPGSVFPDHELPDPDRVTHRLGEIRDEDPLILTIDNGYWFWAVLRSSTSGATYEPSPPRSAPTGI